MTCNKKMITALITGATGFVGSHLAIRLVECGWDVHLILRPNSNLMLIRKILDRLTIHIHDGSTAGMLDIIQSAKPQIVFHLASLFLSEHKPKDIEPMIQSNIIFSSQLVEAMTSNRIYYLVNTGTSWQHFENKDYSPVCLYAATKQAFDDILTYYTETTPLRVTTLKLFDTYGPHDLRSKIFTLLRKASKEQKNLFMSPGEQLIDLVYIDDVIDAFLLAAEQLQKKEHKVCNYAVSTEKPIKLKNLVDIYCHVTGKQLLIKWSGRPYRTREVMVPWNKGNILPGWKPKITLEEGIRRMENA